MDLGGSGRRYCSEFLFTNIHSRGLYFELGGVKVYGAYQPPMNDHDSRSFLMLLQNVDREEANQPAHWMSSIHMWAFLHAPFHCVDVRHDEVPFWPFSHLAALKPTCWLLSGFEN